MEFLLVLLIVAITIVLVTFPKKTTESFSTSTTAVYKYSEISDEYTEPKVFENVITEEEQKYILEKAAPSFSRSMVVGSETPSETRTSETMWISKTDDPVVQPMMKRLCEQFGVPFENAESLQVVKYKPGTYYKEHHDSCCDDTDACRQFTGNSGQRILTILVYLNDDFEAGETHFPTLETKLKAPPRGAVVFHPMSKTHPEACHPKALHAGLPVSTGEKYICNIWIREKPWTS